MTRASYVPERGDVVFLDFTPQAGHEQSGRRPAVVVSPRSYNRKTGLCLACPVTNQVKGYPFEVAFPAGFTVTGVVLADHVRSLDWQARRVVFRTKAPPEVVGELVAKLSTLLA